MAWNGDNKSLMYNSKMCGAFGMGGYSGFGASINILLRFELENKPHWKESYNIRPTQEALIVTRNSPNKGVISKFGIKAPWDEGKLLINAQSETVAEKRTFKKMFRETRCLIPATWFFEWKRLEDGKQPYAFSLKSEEVFSFAGIYNDSGFVILTSRPNSLMEDIHNRMPCILKPEDEDIWLNPDTNENHLLELLSPYPPDDMKRWAVSTLVNKPANNFPEILRPLNPSN